MPRERERETRRLSVRDAARERERDDREREREIQCMWKNTFAHTVFILMFIEGTPEFLGTLTVWCVCERCTGGCVSGKIIWCTSWKDVHALLYGMWLYREDKVDWTGCVDGLEGVCVWDESEFFFSFITSFSFCFVVIIAAVCVCVCVCVCVWVWVMEWTVGRKTF